MAVALGHVDLGGAVFRGDAVKAVAMEAALAWRGEVRR